jgi:hypothetical protein
MNTFNLLSQEKRTELTQMLPDIDTNYPSPLDSQHDFHEPTVNPSLFHKNESPVFWDELHDWQKSYQDDFDHKDLPSCSHTTSTSSSRTDRYKVCDLEPY